MSLLARQFSRPSGIPGRLVTWLLARGNGDFNRWVVAQLVARYPDAAGVIEFGSGPGIALSELVRVYPRARVIGADPSEVVQASSRLRNAAAIAAGRLTLITGDVGAVGRWAPFDLALAVHVLYFWADPVDQLTRIHGVLKPGGRIALGYQLRQQMPAPARRNFPKEGFTLYDSDDRVASVLTAAGFSPPEVLLAGDPASPTGRLAIAQA